MYGFTLGLALFDYLPVLMSGLGMFWLVRLVRYEVEEIALLASLGAVLVVAGGLSKATWKLLVVVQQTDHSWMNDALFACMGPGFLILAVCGVSLVRVQRGGIQRVLHWGWAAILAGSLPVVALALADTFERGSFFTLLGATVLGNLVLMISLITWSSRRGQQAAAALLVLNLIVTFVLSGLARIPEQTASLQWIEEVLNLVAQGAFAWAMLRVVRSAGLVNERV